MNAYLIIVEPNLAINLGLFDILGFNTLLLRISINRLYIYIVHGLWSYLPGSEVHLCTFLLLICWIICLIFWLKKGKQCDYWKYPLFVCLRETNLS